MSTRILLTISALLGLSLASAYDWTADIRNAETLKNTVQVYFQNGSRDAIAVDTPHLCAVGGLDNRESNALTLMTPDGVRLADGTFDTYVVDAEGKTRRSSLSHSSGRFNAFRLGYYYYDVHILDQSMTGGQEGAPPRQTNARLDVSNFRPGKWFVHDLTKPVFTGGAMRLKCVSAHDPWVAQLGIELPADTYPAIEVRLRARHATLMHVYLAVGDYRNFNPQQVVAQGIQPGAFRTYKIYIDEIPGFQGNIHGIRFDLGEVGDVIEIQSVKLVAEKRPKLQVKLDRILHAYPDKMHQVLRFVVGNRDAALREYGCEARFAKAAIAKVVVKDRNGIHDGFHGVDADSVEYVGFDHRQGGVFGLIFPTCPEAGRVALAETASEYILTQSRLSHGVLKPGTRLLLAHRLYRDASHDFAALAEAAFCERHPLGPEAVRILDGSDGGRFLGYNKLDGTYDFALDGTHFSAAYYNMPQKHFRLPVSIAGDGHDRRIYFCIRSKAGGLECAAMLDEQEKLLPMPIQVSKNFRGDGEEPFFYPEDAGYGETLFPLLLGARTERSFAVLDLYQNWGAAPLKQLSAIKFVIPYYHLSCGVTETNCIAPYYVGGKSGWTLPDFRAMSAKLWTSQPQHYSVGPLYFPCYRQRQAKILFEPKHQQVRSAGPVYADVDFVYESDDQAATLTARHLEFPQTDENRTYYSFSIDFKKAVAFQDFQRDFSLFSFSTTWTKFAHLGYLDRGNRPVVVGLPQKKPLTAMIPLGQEAPYFSVYTSLGNAHVCNFGLVVRKIDVRVGGRERPARAVLNFTDTPVVDARLTLDLGEVAFQPGDRIAYDLILVPFGDHDVQTDQSVRQVRADSALRPYRVEVAVGKLLPDTYLPRVQAVGQQAEFTLGGGRNNAAVRVDGFRTFERPRILVKDAQGAFVPLKVSHHAYDGIQSYLNPDGTYGFAFAVDTTDGPRTLRVVQ